MGIQGLLGLARRVIRKTDLLEWAGCHLAVDLLPLIHTLVHVIPEDTPDAFLDALEVMVKSWTRASITIVFVVDSNERSTLKHGEIARRTVSRRKQAARHSVLASRLKEAEEKVRVHLPGESSPVDLEALRAEHDQSVRNIRRVRGELIELAVCSLTAWGYVVRQTPPRREAEWLCARLGAMGLVDAVVTNDSDAIAFGAPVVIFDLWSRERARTVRLDDVLRELDVPDMRAFQETCILLGHDYFERIPGKGPVAVFDAMRRCGFDGARALCRLASHLSSDDLTSLLAHFRKVADVFAETDLNKPGID